VVSILVVLWGVNLVCVGSTLDLVAGRSVLVSRRWPWLRWGLAGAPLVGIVAVSLIGHDPESGDREPESGDRETDEEGEACPGTVGVRPRLARPAAPDTELARWAHRLEMSVASAMSRRWVALTLILTNLVLVEMLALWAGASGALEGSPAWLAAAAAHLLGAALMASALVDRARDGRHGGLAARLYPYLAAFWLVPAPLAGLVGLVVLAFLESRLESIKLVERLGQALSGGRRLPAWAALESDLRDWRPGLPARLRRRRRAAAGGPNGWREEHASQRSAYYRLRCGLLLPEGAALAHAVMSLAGVVSGSRDGPGLALVAVACLSAAAGLAGTVMMLCRFWGRALLEAGARPPAAEEAPPYGAYLAGSQLAFAAGVLIGLLCYLGEHRSAGGILLLSALAGALFFVGRLLLSILPWVPDPEDGGRLEWMIWPILLATLALAGLQIARASDPDAVTLILLLQAGLGPGVLVGPALGWLLLPRMLAPFSVSDRDSRRASPAIRRPVSLMLLTSIAPLGGLAVPLWLYLRHRRWPGMIRAHAGSDDRR
jgi:hypothetical protein